MRVKGARRGAKRSFEKAFDGWQLGLAVVLFAWAMVMLVVPRPTSPTEVPAPEPTLAELRALRDVESAREARALRDLAPLLRTLGAAVRAYGRAESAGDASATGAAMQEITSAVAATAHVPIEEVLDLRALQTAAFVRSVRQLERTGAAERDVIELGGDMVRAFRETGWATDVDGRMVVALSDDELGAAYRKRWNRLLGVRPSAAPANLVEERLLFALAVRRRDPRAGARGIETRSLLRRVDEFARVDPSYPVDFARGVVLFGSGTYGAAQVAFARHLDTRPDGPLTLRARNFARGSMFADVEGHAP